MAASRMEGSSVIRSSWPFHHQHYNAFWCTTFSMARGWQEGGFR
jgi:hypothetical protein